MNKMIDHTLLKPDSTLEQLEKLCSEASEFDFATVCVNPGRISAAASFLEGSNVGVCTVIGFPLGANTSETKAFETKNSIEAGATEVDMVINIGALKDNNTELVYNDIKAVVDAANGTCVKVIIETALLTDQEKVTACELSEKAGANFVKTSTGFASGGATLEDVKLMRKTVSDHIEVKASGGIRDVETAKAMIEAGATRLGTSSGIAIIKGETGSSNY